MLVMKILDLNFKEPRNKVLNLKLGFNVKERCLFFKYCNYFG